MRKLHDDRRLYSRLDLEHKILLYIGPSNQEVFCAIKDISENGICFRASKHGNKKEVFVLGDEFWFQYVDVFKFGSEDEMDIISEECKIIRVDEYKEYFDVGCSIYSKSFSEYVKKRKLVENL